MGNARKLQPNKTNTPSLKFGSTQFQPTFSLYNTKNVGKTSTMCFSDSHVLHHPGLFVFYTLMVCFYC